jgi:hypothetical protein
VKPPQNLDPEAQIEAYYLIPDYRESYLLLGQALYRLKDMSGSEQAFKLYLKYGGDRERVVSYFPHLLAD